VSADVAHPADWEVWGPPTALPPPGFQARLEQQRLRQRRLLQGRVVQGGSAGAWQRLAGPVRIQAPQGLRWQGGVFAGPFRLQADASDRWTLVEQVPLERYLLGVVPHEIGAGSPPAALAAQAVLARTWALRNRQRFAVDGYHLCADTQCQVYGDPRQAGAAVRQAVSATAGRVLAWRGEPIHAVYHASNGGVAADEDEAWPLPELPYLEAFLDWSDQGRPPVRLPLSRPQDLLQVLNRRAGAYGGDHPRFRWRRLIAEADLREAVGARAAALGAPLRLLVLERGASGRVVRLAIAGPGGQEVLVRDAIRRRLRQLPSTLFVLQPAGAGAWWFEGGGFGHGAGLSQAGAIDLAGRGWSLQRILNHYYPGTALLPVQQLQGQPSGGL
jgi:SpoIID/LytB domain protein